jgi:hypothetical protein
MSYLFPIRRLDRFDFSEEQPDDQRPEKNGFWFKEKPGDLVKLLCTHCGKKSEKLRAEIPKRRRMLSCGGIVSPISLKSGEAG